MSGPGRPSSYTEALADEVVRDISEGVTLSDICRRDHMPNRSTVYAWMRENEEFSQRIARARDLGFDAIAEEVLTIVDDDSRDWEAIRDDDGTITGVKVDGEHVQRSKLRAEYRLKLLAKWDPKRYGDKVDLNHGGEVGLVVNIKRYTPDPDGD